MVSARRLTDQHNRDKSHVEFVQAYYKAFRSLAAYVKEHFPTGLTWNSKDGIDALEGMPLSVLTASPRLQPRDTETLGADIIETFERV